MRVFSFICLVLISTSVFAEDTKIKNETKTNDNLYLESTLIGDKEQPTVSYFIPWKGTGAPDNLYWNLEQKKDRSLELVDRDILTRSIAIYNELDMESAESINK